MIILLLLAVTHWVAAIATETDCSYTFFDSGSVASARCLSENGAIKTIRFFNRRGAVIGEWTLLLRPRVSSVRISFYPDGMVSRVDYSYQPDGGIQWYRSTTLYEQDGTIAEFREDSWDRVERLRGDR